MASKLASPLSSRINRSSISQRFKLTCSMSMLFLGHRSAAIIQGTAHVSLDGIATRESLRLARHGTLLEELVGFMTRRFIESYSG
mmetsp:Transcript_9531/g.20098  ORF Transcript_9531/g.20098 Transcript_9531/m.20098 type:complete len:85 (+) Transcript_9531:190-444(+)